jgi:TonB-dependent receptor
MAQGPAPAKSPATSEDDTGEEASETARSAKEDADSEQSAAEAAAAEEAAMEAELAEAEGPGPDRPPPRGKAVIWGVVTDTKFDEAMIEAQLEVVGTNRKTFTDVNGAYRLELPPGTYSLRVRYELHQPARVNEVTVVAGEVERVDLKMVPDETAVEEVEIVSEIDRTSTEGQTLERKRSAVVSDGVGRAEIARTPDRNAAEAAQRVVGATIVGGRFVYVRGLGERYTNALLNGAPLPSPEPDRSTVPLDLFPSLVLDSLTISKQFTPDMPADFAGGSVRINTRQFPRERLFQISLSGAYNTKATFRDRISYRGSKTDWLGYDSGYRGLASQIPDDRRVDSSNFTEEERVALGKRVNTYMSTTKKGTPPNHGVSLVAGDSVKLGEKKLGALLALTYGRTYQLRELIARTYTRDDIGEDQEGLIVADEFAGRQSVDTVRWGAFGSASLELAEGHKLGLVLFRSQSADDTVVDSEGFRESSANFLHTTHLEYVTRALNFAQLRGDHELKQLNGLEIAWHGALARATREQPDTRDIRYQRATDEDGTVGWQFVSDGSGLHSFMDQSEDTFNGGLDVTQPIIKNEKTRTSIKVGTLLTSRERAFRARRFQIEPVSRGLGDDYGEAAFCGVDRWHPGCPDKLFRQRLVSTDGLILEEWTLNLDQYDARLVVYSGYGMLDTQLSPELRAIGGVRVEATDQNFVGYDPFQRDGTELYGNLDSTDVLPALSVVYATSSKSNTRFGVSKTLARPQLREIAPVLSTSYSGELSVQGNPNLRMTKITNADLRFEHFPTMREVLAFSFFYKHFVDPIEEVAAVGSGTINFANAKAANLIGIELESRKGLGFLAPALGDFSVLGNVTLVYSKVDLVGSSGAATNPRRALSYQSPYIVNFALDYANDKLAVDARLLYNVYGPRITTTGSQRLPDTYEEERHLVDFTVAKKIAKRFELKLQAQNLLRAPVVYSMRNQTA